MNSEWYKSFLAWILLGPIFVPGIALNALNIWTYLTLATSQQYSNAIMSI